MLSLPRRETRLVKLAERNFELLRFVYSRRLQLRLRFLLQLDKVAATKWVQSWFQLGLENLEKREGIFQLGKSQGILPKILEK